MAVSGGFFNSKGLDRTYSAENFTDYLSSLICDGILDTYGENFDLSAGDGLNVIVGTGKAWIGGHYFVNDTPYGIDLAQYKDNSLPRYVSIAVVCDTSDDVRKIDFEVLVGKPAESPEIPTVGENEHRKGLRMYAVRLNPSATSLTRDDWYDFREDDGYCGYCKCILGKCKVSEMLEQMSELLAEVQELNSQVKIYNSTLNTVSNSIYQIQKRLGLLNYRTPDADGDGQVDAADASLTMSFYSWLMTHGLEIEGTTQKKWEYFLENDQHFDKEKIQKCVLPDTNCDGMVDSRDSGDILAFYSALSTGRYTGENGFKDFMYDQNGAIFNSAITGLRVMSKDDYEKLDEKKPDILYIVPSEGVV